MSDLAKRFRQHVDQSGGGPGEEQKKAPNFADRLARAINPKKPPRHPEALKIREPVATIGVRG